MSASCASICQGGAAAALAPAGARCQRPLACSVPPPSCARSVRTVAVSPCQLRSACRASIGRRWRSQGPAAVLVRSAVTAQPGAAAASAAGSGARSTRPPSWVRGAAGHSAPRSIDCSVAWASGSGCGAQGVMRAVAWARGAASAPLPASVGGGAVASGSGGSAGADAAAAAGAACASGCVAGGGSACTSACARRSARGPRSVACSVSGSVASASGSGGASAPARARSSWMGASSPSVARACQRPS